MNKVHDLENEFYELLCTAFENIHLMCQKLQTAINVLAIMRIELNGICIVIYIIY